MAYVRWSVVRFVLTNTVSDTWGLTDVEAALSAIPEWIRRMNWVGPGVEVDEWFVTGHSNGGWLVASYSHARLISALLGQGTWFILTHRPDVVMAAAPVSGYSSIQGQTQTELPNQMC